MWQVATAQDSDLRMALAGSGFRDFTRIAAGSAEVWRDIFLSNRPAVLAELQEVKAALLRAEQALEEADGDKLQDFLERAALARRFWGSRSGRSEEHTSELQSLMRISYAVFCFKKKTKT